MTVLSEVALKPSEACGVLIGDGCGSPYNPLDQNWTVPLPAVPKPPVVPIQPPAVSPSRLIKLNYNFIFSSHMQDSAPKSRILHLSDLHIDMDYTPGLTNDCGEPLCCRPPNDIGMKSEIVF